MREKKCEFARINGFTTWPATNNYVYIIVNAGQQLQIKTKIHYNWPGNIINSSDYKPAKIVWSAKNMSYDLMPGTFSSSVLENEKFTYWTAPSPVFSFESRKGHLCQLTAHLYDNTSTRIIDRKDILVRVNDFLLKPSIARQFGTTLNDKGNIIISDSDGNIYSASTSHWSVYEKIGENCRYELCGDWKKLWRCKKCKDVYGYAPRTGDILSKFDSNSKLLWEVKFENASINVVQPGKGKNIFLIIKSADGIQNLHNYTSEGSLIASIQLEKHFNHHFMFIDDYNYANVISEDYSNGSVYIRKFNTEGSLVMPMKRIAVNFKVTDINKNGPTLLLAGIKGSAVLSVMKFDLKFNELRSETIIDSPGIISSISVDQNENIYLSAVTSYQAVGINDTGTGNFLMKLDPFFSKLWVVNIESTVNQNYSMVTTPLRDSLLPKIGITPDNNIVVLSKKNTLLDEPFGSLIIEKYNAAGVKINNKGIYSTANDWYGDLSIDQFGNIYIIGSTNGGLFNPSSAGGSDYFIIKSNEL